MSGFFVSLHKEVKMKIDLNELVNQQIITQDTADKIKLYYQKNPADTHQRLLLIFGIIGAVLTGLGVILLIAHNWDEFSRSTKTFLALIPLLVSQACGFYTLIKKPESKTWREVSAVLIFFSIASSISMVAQIYHISGDYPGFLMTWLALSLPLVYIFRSSFVSLMYILLLTHFASATNSWQYRNINTKYFIVYLVFLTGIIPYYYHLIKKEPHGNITAFHHWFIAISLSFALLVFRTTDQTDVRIIVFITLLGLYALTGNFSYFQSLHFIKRAYYIIGVAGLSGILIFLSFEYFWQDKRHLMNSDNELLPVFWIFILSIIIFITAYAFLFKQKKLDGNPFNFLALLFILLYFMPFTSMAGQFIMNLTGLLTGIYFIRKGNKNNDLFDLNAGMLLLSALIIARFFDTGISFVIRGILFIILGIAFFAVNYILVQKKKKNEV